MKEMEYKPWGKAEILDSGTFEERKYAIVSVGDHPNAYVQVFGDVYGENDSKLDDIDVHCGFTYVGESYWDKESTPALFAGWDYAHSGDYIYLSSGYNPPWNTKKWTTEEILTEVKSVIKQLNEKGNV